MTLFFTVRFFTYFIQSKPIEINWFNVRYSQVVQFLVFCFLLDMGFFAFDAN